MDNSAWMETPELCFYVSRFKMSRGTGEELLGWAIADC